MEQAKRGRRRDSKTQQALDMVGKDKGDGTTHTVYSAAKEMGIKHVGSLYRILRQQAKQA